MKRRTGGSGPWDGRQFERNGDVKRFKALVEANGHTMPPPEQLIEHGFGCLPPAGVAAPAPEPAEEKLTFRAYAEQWLGQLVKPHPETVRKYRERLEKHVFPRLGDRPILREMREWQQGLPDAGLSAKTIANIRGESVLPIFKKACRPGEDEEPAVRTYNPMDGLPLPEGPSAERDILESPAEARLFLEAAYAVDPEAADLLLTKLATELLLAGQRRTEVTAAARFFDQAHLTRHFRRHLGVGPARCADRSGGANVRGGPVKRPSGPAPAFSIGKSDPRSDVHG